MTIVPTTLEKKWIWKRTQGDIEVNAPTIHAALARIREHGFRCPGIEVIQPNEWIEPQEEIK